MKPGRRAKVGLTFKISDELSATVTEMREDGNRIIRLNYDGIFEEILDRAGEMPLPPYITERLNDKTRYQTVYAKENGSAAAPTAGLHFTDELLSRISEKGIDIAVSYVIVGLVIAVLGGTIIEKLHLENQVADFIRNAKNINTVLPSDELSQKERFKSALDSVLQTLKKVFPYILIGVAIGAVVHNWIPQKWIENILGSKNPFGVILATICGIPMYADIFGCIPIAESLLAKGALFVFTGVLL